MGGLFASHLILHWLLNFFYVRIIQLFLLRYRSHLVWPMRSSCFIALKNLYLRKKSSFSNQPSISSRLESSNSLSKWKVLNTITLILFMIQSVFNCFMYFVHIFPWHQGMDIDIPCRTILIIVSTKGSVCVLL